MMQQYVGGGISTQDERKGNNKRSGSTETGYGIGDAFAEGFFLFDDLIWISRRTQTHKLLRSVELAPEHGKHIHSGVGLAFEQNLNVVAIDFKADGFLLGNS